jgi:hypothetical protein
MSSLPCRGCAERAMRVPAHATFLCPDYKARVWLPECAIHAAALDLYAVPPAKRLPTLGVDHVFDRRDSVYRVDTVLNTKLPPCYVCAQGLAGYAARKRTSRFLAPLRQGDAGLTYVWVPICFWHIGDWHAGVDPDERLPMFRIVTPAERKKAKEKRGGEDGQA